MTGSVHSLVDACWIPSPCTKTLGRYQDSSVDDEEGGQRQQGFGQKLKEKEKKKREEIKKGKGPNTKSNKSKGEEERRERGRGREGGGVQPHDFRKGPESQDVF